MLELSDDAVREIKELTESGGLRFEGIAGEDGSFRFDPSLADEPEEGDEVVERDGAKVFLDAVAAEKLADQILEIESHGDHVHFDFVPQAGGNGDDAGSGGGTDGDGGPDEGPAAA
jgi:Fe-S cluster assembly iron-binding protein IscA